MGTQAVSKFSQTQSGLAGLPKQPVVFLAEPMVRRCLYLRNLGQRACPEIIRQGQKRLRSISSS